MYISKANACKFIVASLTVTSINTNPSIGLDNGVITAVVSGGTAPYLYSINRGVQQSSNQFTGLAEGTYVIQVVDNFGLIGYVSVILVENVDCGSYSGATWDDISVEQWLAFANCIWNDFN
jgi:hypothetical protein